MYIYIYGLFSIATFDYQSPQAQVAGVSDKCESVQENLITPIAHNMGIWLTGLLPGVNRLGKGPSHTMRTSGIFVPVCSCLHEHFVKMPNWLDQ